MNNEELSLIMDVLKEISETIEEIHSCIENDIAHTLGEVNSSLDFIKNQNELMLSDMK